MSSDALTAQINQYNQQASQLENAACENIFAAYKYLSENLLAEQAFLNHYQAKQREHWLEILNEWILASLKGMLLAKTAEELNSYQENIHTALNRIKTNIPHPETSDVYKLITVCEKNVTILADTRENYLEKISGHATMAKNFGWMALGAALIVVGIVIPPIEIVAIGLGVAGLVYGTVDYAKEAAENYMENRFPKLGKRQPDNLTTPVKTLLTPAEKPAPAKSSYKKGLKIATLAASGIGLLSGFGGLLAVLPGLALLFPPALPFVFAAIGLAAAVTVGVIYAHKVYSERKELKAAQEQQKQIQATAEEQLDKLAEHALDSTALLEKELLGVKPDQDLNQQQKENLASELKHMDENLAEKEEEKTDTDGEAEADTDTESGSGESESDSKSEAEKIIEELSEPHEELRPK